MPGADLPPTEAQATEAWSAKTGSVDDESSMVVADEPSDLLNDSALDDEQEQAARLLAERWVVEDPCRWTIFEDLEDELQYHKRRSRALTCFVKAYSALRDEYDQLQEGGLALQDAYEQLQGELKDAVGDAAYWRELAEARAELEAASKDEELASTRQTPEDEAPQPSAANPPDEPADASASVSAEGVPEVLPEAAPGTREALRSDMLRDAKAQVTRWRRLAQQREEEITKLKAQLQNSKSSAPGSPSTTSGLTQMWRELSKQPSAPASPNRTAGATSWRDLVRRGNVAGSTPDGVAVQVAPAPSPLPRFSPQQTPPLSSTPHQRGNVGESAAESRLERDAKHNAGGTSASAGLLRQQRRSDAVASAAPPTNRRIDFSDMPRKSLGPTAACSSTTDAHAAVPTPSRAWGPGSAPKRCLGLGAPTRRKQQNSESASQHPAGGSSVSQPSNGKASDQACFDPRPRKSILAKPAPSAEATPASKDTAPGTKRQSLSGSVSLGLPQRKSFAARDTLSRDAPDACNARIGTRTPPPPEQRSRALARGASPRPHSEKSSVLGSGDSASHSEGMEEELCIPKHITGLATIWDRRG